MFYDDFIMIGRRQTVPKISAYFISDKMFASYVFRDKNQKPLRMSHYANYQANGGYFVTNF